MKAALVTGVTGQDGSYLAELLAAQGYDVHGLVRRSTRPLANPCYTVHYGDILDAGAVMRLVQTVRPSEVYNLAAQSDVAVSFVAPTYTATVDAIGALNMLEAVRLADWPIRYYQAGSSEMYGDALPPQGEGTPFRPRSPYAAAKAFAHHATVNYREAYGLYAVNGILFNHESPRRSPDFVTRKVTQGVARIVAGRQSTIRLGNLDARRDWGWAPEYVEMMWRMLQAEQPRDYVIATGMSRSVRDLVERAFAWVGIEGWDRYVEIDRAMKRPTDVEHLRGVPTPGWEPTLRFPHVVREMLRHDLEEAGCPDALRY